MIGLSTSSLFIYSFHFYSDCNENYMNSKMSDIYTKTTHYVDFLQINLEMEMCGTNPFCMKTEIYIHSYQIVCFFSTATYHINN